MTLYLIAHKVRGEAAFDVAQQSICTLCQSYTSVTGDYCEPRALQSECGLCNGLGYMWIIPTSGHRAYPYWHEPIWNLIESTHGEGWFNYLLGKDVSDLPDHYPNPRAQEPAPKRIDSRRLLESLGLVKPVVINRRLGT